MRRTLLSLLILAAALAFCRSGAAGAPVACGGTVDGLAPSSVGMPATLLPSPSTVDRVGRGGGRRTIGPGTRPAALLRAPTLDRLAAPRLDARFVRAAATLRLDFAADQALSRAGIDAWRTAAPPPFDSV